VKHLFNTAADIGQFDLVNSSTFKDLWNEIQGLSSTCPIFKYFLGLEFRRKNSSTFKDVWNPDSDPRPGHRRVITQRNL